MVQTAYRNANAGEAGCFTGVMNFRTDSSRNPASRSCGRLCLRNQTFALGALAGELAGAANRFGLPASLRLGRLLEGGAGLHFPEDAFTLHLLLERFQRLIDVVIADHDLNYLKLSIGSRTGTGVISRMQQTPKRPQTLPLEDALARSTGDLFLPVR
jgi:hypothetical protein